jgi:hypothetical protein
MNAPDPDQCGAELRHAHGVTRCIRDPFHAEPVPLSDRAELEQHVGTCEGCDEDDGYASAVLHWIGWREQW